MTLLEATKINPNPPAPEAPPFLEEERPHLRTDPGSLYDLDAEAALLGAILIDGAQLAKCDHLDISVFHDHRHRVIWQAFKDLDSRNLAIEYLTVCSELTRAGKLDEIGGDAYLSSLISAPGSSQNVRSYVKIISKYAVRRRMLADGNQLANQAYDDNAPVPPEYESEELGPAALCYSSGS